jgi:ATP adenylyltransferase
MEQALNHLWSPWRMTYIQNDNKEVGCVFCNALSNQDDDQNLVVHRGESAFVILNRYPYTSGHLMIVPNSHASSLQELSAGTRAELMELASRSIQVLNQVYRPQGYNLGMNLGEVAGAGIAEHVHVHVVPRWGGDTSFMSTTADTRVLPEALEDTYARVHKAWLTSEE